MNFTKQAIDEVRVVDRIFEYVSNGSKQDLIKLKNELDNDPKKHFFSIDDPKHLINRKNAL